MYINHDRTTNVTRDFLFNFIEIVCDMTVIHECIKDNFLWFITPKFHFQRLSFQVFFVSAMIWMIYCSDSCVYLLTVEKDFCLEVIT
jgi:hypothetical protein